MKNKLSAVMFAGGAIGLLASFLQSVEKISLLKHQSQSLACDLNSVFSCTNVLNAHQSAVFGFPNSFMCMVLFTIFMTVGLVMLWGGTASKGMRLFTHGLAKFTLFFGLWFLWQSTYRINALCIFCLFCFTGLLMINAAWVRVNAADLPIPKVWHKRLDGWIAKSYDLIAWVLLAALLAGCMIVKFH